MDTSLDMDSMNLLQEMEDISNALKKQQLQQVSNSETITDINQLINNENNISSDDDISNMPVSSFQNNSIQKERLSSISNAIQNNKKSRYISTDNESDIFVSAKEDFVTASELSETELDRSDEDMFTKQRKKSSSADLKKEHMKMRISSFNSDIFNKRLFSMNSDILNHVTISDEKGNNSRQVSQEVTTNEKEENTFILDEQTQDVTKMLQRIDTGLTNNHLIMDSDNSTSLNNTIDSEGDFNSSFSLKIANKESDESQTSENESMASVKYSKFENEIKNNSNLRMSSGDEKRSVSSSSNKFRTNRIISPSQIVQISPNLPSFGSFENSFAVFDYSFDKPAGRSEYKDVMNRIVSSEVEYPLASTNNSQLDQSRNVLRNLRRRVTSDILRAEISDTENTTPTAVNNSNNRISSSHSLLSEMNKLWDSAISVTSKDEQPLNHNDKPEIKSSNEVKVSHIWKNEKSSLDNLDVDGYKQSELVKRTLKNSDDHVIQRTSTGLGIYHNLELVTKSSNEPRDPFIGSAKFEENEENSVNTKKKVIIGNVQDLLLENGISLHDIKFDQQTLKIQNDEGVVETHDVLPETPKNKSTAFESMRVSSPVKVVNREIKEVDHPVVEKDESTIDEINEADGRKKFLKLKNNELSNLGYLYISLTSLSLTNFINKAYPTLSFVDKKAEIQVLFDNGEKVIESAWIPLTALNSGFLSSSIDISSQEYMTEIPIKQTLDGYDSIVTTLNFTFKMRYEQPKSRFVEIQDRIPIVQKGGDDRTNSLTKKIFSLKNRPSSSSSTNGRKGGKVEYQTVIKKVEQKVADPWSTNFAPDGETFGLVTMKLSFAELCAMTNVLEEKKYGVLSTSIVNKQKLLSEIGELKVKVLHLSHVNKAIPKSISAINEILSRKERVLGVKFDRHGVMYQQGLDLPENSGVRRRRFVLENGLLNGYSVDDVHDLKVSINLENVSDVVLDCESCPAPGFNFEMIFDDKSKVVLSCDTINQRKLWLGKIKEVLDVLRVVRELDIEIRS